jgi:CheY-like chemotaxis protein
MTRFGDFTLLEDLGRSAVADRYKAMHATQGGPFFLKVYSRLDPSMHGELLHRCEALIGKQHPNLARHLGHGVVDGLPFVVAPYLEGIDLQEMSASLLDRRVNLGLESVLLVLGDLTTGVGALHNFAPTNNGVPFMGHGDVSIHHVRVGTEGQIWLTGLTTPRGESPQKPPEHRWDLAGVGALVYDLVPLLRGGAARPPLPAPFDRVVRRALGISPADERVMPAELVERLGEVAVALKLKPDRGAFAELVKRTVRAVEKKLAEQGGRPAPAVPGRTATPPSAGRRSPADAIPSLDPVDQLPTLEPILDTPRAPAPPVAPVGPARPAPILELIPVDGPLPDVEATTKLVQRPRPISVAPAAPVAQPPSRAQPPPGAPQPALRAPTSLPPGLAPPGWDDAPPAIVGRPEPAAPPITPAPPSARPWPAAQAPAPPVAPPIAAPVTPPPRPQRPTPGPTTPTLEDPFIASPHTDPRAITLPRRETPLETLAPPDASPFGALPDDITGDGLLSPAAATAPPPASSAAPPPLPPKTKPPVVAKKPLLADPVADSAAPPKKNPALDEVTRDATDPDVRATKAEQARRDPGVRALLARRMVTEAAVQAAVDEHVARGGRMLEILVAHGATNDTVVADVLAAESQRPRLLDDALRARLPMPALAKRLPQTYLLARRVLPLALNNGVLALALADPFDRATIDELKSLLGATSVETFVAARGTLTACTVEVYRALSMGAVGGVPGTNSSSPTVLLITPDDTKATRIGARLAQEGMRVEHVVDGNAAKVILTTRPPEVVIAGHDVAGQTVSSLLLFVREQPRTAELPFYVFGPRGDEELAARIVDLGADDFFTEPLKLEVVLAKLRRALGKGRLNPEGWALNDPSGAARILTQPPMPTSSGPPSLDEQTPINAIPLPTAPPIKRAEPSFLDNISMDGLDDLPELPPDFGEPSMPEGPPAMPTGVMGTLRQMSLPEIVQSLEMGRKTARVDLVPADGEKGMIAFETGAIRYAECGAKRGDDAFFQLARHKEGFFRIHYGDKPPSVNIDAPTTFLLLEAMRRMDEERNV